jgi:predicted helicase
MKSVEKTKKRRRRTKGKLLYSRHFIKLTDIFPLYGVGIVTARDKLTIHFNKEQAFQLVSDFSSYTGKEELSRNYFNLGKDTRDWKLKKAQQDIIESNIDIDRIVPILYRPFDIRYTYYTGKTRGFICMPRLSVMSHMLRENIGLITAHQVPEGDYSHCFVADTIIDSRLITMRRGISYIFPLYKYDYPPQKRPQAFNIDFRNPNASIPMFTNINPTVFTRLQKIFGFDNPVSASQIFYYIYAILNSGIYRKLYREQLKIDFPHIPFTPDFDLFIRLSSLGEGLAAIHRMKSWELMQTFSKFEVTGYNLVEDPHFKPSAGETGRIYINDSQYFSNISKELWDFQVCGYQILKKWLRERLDRILTPVEVRYFIEICRALQLTSQYRERIDGLYSQLEI